MSEVIETKAPGGEMMPQKVKIAPVANTKKHGLRPAQKLERTTFITSRVMDFFSERELVTQTGHGRHEWPLVFIKEMVDNALDACDEAAVLPVIEITCDPSGITVADNGPGLPESTLIRQMDFGVRASNREAYVAPTRGAQGNALKTILPMPSVVDPNGGRLIVAAHGKRHTIRCRADQISQQPVIEDDVQQSDTNGTLVSIEWMPRLADGAAAWPFSGWQFDRVGGGVAFDGIQRLRRFKTLIAGFALFNPHATIRLNWFGTLTEYAATDTTFGKWLPCQPTSPHWYEQRHIERLIGAYITHDKATGHDRLVSEFIAEFDGLSGSLKRSEVLNACSMKRVRLADLGAYGRFDSGRIAELLAAMRAHTRPVKAKRLGVIGRDHFYQLFTGMGCIAESFEYRKVTAQDGMPYVIETAFAHRDKEDDEHNRSNRLIFTGVNWSSAINNPWRSFGNIGEGLESILAKNFISGNEPILLAVHLAHPRVEYTDRGKSAMVLSDEPKQEGDDK